MNAVILGYGVVGKGIEILAKALDDINIKYVYVRKEKENLPYFSNNEDMVVQDDIDIVFECLNGLEPANTLIQKALKKGKHVISSNKAVVATYLDTYLELEKEYGGSIQVEACVAGGIPFIDALLKLKRLEPLQGYEGIFNGTSNYILDSMQKNNLDFEDVLKQAQEKGYAEKDPSNDIDGVDVYYKTKISNSLAFNTPIVDIPYYAGIRTIKMLDIKFIKMNNKVLRHLSISRQIGDKIISMVSTDAAPIKRMIQNARDEGKAVDATCGRRTRAVLVMESGHLILSALTTDTLSSRCHSKRNDEDEENER